MHHKFRRGQTLKVFVGYQSGYGQSKKIAEFIAHRLDRGDTHVDLVDIEYPCPRIDMEGIDVFILGGSVQFGEHHPALVDFVIKNLETISAATVSAFFSVSLSVVEDRDSAYPESQQLVDEFLAKTGWTPNYSDTFAGALAYPKYGRLTRFLMGWLASRVGGESDTSRSFEYTEWKRIDAFLNRIGGVKEDTGKVA